MNEIDIWRTAQLLISQHGTNAELEAAMRADVALNQGNHEAELVRKRIGKTILVLSATSSPSGAAKH